MFNQRDIIAGLEIGTSKVCAMIGEIGEDDALSILGIGQTKSRGVRKGEIIDSSKVVEDIRAVLGDAEEMANAEITRLFLGVTGGHIQGLNNRGVHPIMSADRLITEEDVEDVMRNAKVINLPPDKHPLHVIRQHFSVEGQEGIVNPIGIQATRLEADVHVIHGTTNRMQTGIRLLKGLQIDVEDVVFNGLASALSCLSREQKELGSLVIDIGAGTTEYTLYAGGIIRYTGVLPVGGDHITNDLAFGLKVSMSRAEKLKRKYGAAIVDGNLKRDPIIVSGGDDPLERSVNGESLQTIMSARVEEILELIHQELYENRLLGLLRSSVLICGGGARIPKIEDLAQRIFAVPYQPGKAMGVNGLTKALEAPEFACPIGLLKCAAFQMKRRERTKLGLRSALAGLFKR